MTAVVEDFRHHAPPRDLDASPEEALEQLRRDLEILQDRSRAQAAARPLRGLVRMAKADGARLGRGGAATALFFVVAGVAGLTAYACAVVAAVVWLSRSFDVVTAAALVALGFFVATAAALGLAIVTLRRERRWLSSRAAIYEDAGGLLLKIALGPQLSALISAMTDGGAKDAPR